MNLDSVTFTAATSSVAALPLLLLSTVDASNDDGTDADDSSDDGTADEEIDDSSEGAEDGKAGEAVDEVAA
jgi:hypothetical protein